MPNTPPAIPNVPVEVTTKPAVKTVTPSAVATPGSVATPSTIVTPSPVQPVIPTKPKSASKPNKPDEPTVLKPNTPPIVSDKKPEVNVTKLVLVILRYPMKRIT